MRYLFLFIFITACVPQNTLTADRNPHQLPLVHGYVSYQQTVVKKGIKFNEFYRVARSWFRENKETYALEWERPFYKRTLLHSAIIPSSRIADSQIDYHTNRTVHYLITIDAKDDSCRVLLSNFEVCNNDRSGIELEKLATDKELCQSVNREMNLLGNSLGSYIKKNAEKGLR